MRLDQLLAEAAERFPEQIAAEEPDGGCISYSDLNAMASRLCEFLQRVGVEPGDRIGVCAPKRISTLALVFATLRAGAAYVPVDVGAPPARNAYIFNDCAVRLVVGEHSALDRVRAESPLRVYTQAIQISALAPLECSLVAIAAKDGGAGEFQSSAAGIAYILYTSGSTGRPKGVIHTHQSALSFVDWCSKEYEPNTDDCYSSHAPLHFDLSIHDIFVPVKHAARIVLIDDRLGKQPATLSALIAQHRITIWYSTPSILRLLLEFGKLESRNCSSLRTVIFAGEVFPMKHLRALKNAWPQPDYYNLYGPTETNVCTYYRIPAVIPEEHERPVPIGWVCSGDRVYIADPGGEEAPAGQEGELFVTGGSVMQGYWNLAQRNEEAFFVDSSGTRWYKTGDIVRAEPDGAIAYVGRIDRMVKRRGYRVELGEIESALYRHPSISEAAVIATTNADDDIEVQAFLVWSGEERASTIKLKQFCAQALPVYMVPDRFSIHDELPKTSTDKIDYQQLKGLS